MARTPVKSRRSLIASTVLSACVVLGASATSHVQAGGPECNGLPATITGNDNDNLLVGTPGDDVIVGRKGNDVIKGRGGADTLCGFRHPHPGNSVGRDDDLIIGGGGDDDLFGDHLRDRLRGEGGSDLLVGNFTDSEYNINRTDKDKLAGGGDDDTLVGDAVIDYGVDAADDLLKGGKGEDTLYGDSRSTDLTQNATTGGIGRDDLRGGDDDDYLDGQRSRDRCRGGAGTNTLVNCES